MFERQAGSFRDPGGYIFALDGEIFRHILPGGLEDYRCLIASGLYQNLTSKGLLVSHQEVTDGAAYSGSGLVIQPVKVPFVSYPYEWSFSQLKDAGLLTLEICRLALEHEMILKDANAYNVQFVAGKPVFIDTGSFSRYEEGQPWEGYRQFCQHFLAPLVLASKVDIGLLRLLESHIDGIPLNLASKLLPIRTWLSWKTLAHIHLHARAQKKFNDTAVEKVRKPAMSRTGLLGILDGLSSAIKKLDWSPDGTEWADYYDFTNYSESSAEVKLELIREFTDQVKPRTIWDLGGNVGVYSRGVVRDGTSVICWDIDPAAVEKNYRQTRASGETRILPLIQDLTNPSKGLGWANAERSALEDRGPADMALALALVHHLAISNNVPFRQIAEYFSRLCHHLLIEFVPKEDSQVQKLLASRVDIFDTYTLDNFSNSFAEYFIELDRVPIEGTVRTLLLLRSRVAS